MNALLLNIETHVRTLSQDLSAQINHARTATQEDSTRLPALTGYSIAKTYGDVARGQNICR